MKTNKLSLALATAFVAFALIFSACSKTGVNANRDTVAVYMTDGPGEYDSVFIDITKVEVKVDTTVYKKEDGRCDKDDDRDDHEKRKDDYGYWVDLSFTPAIIDVLSLRNGVETKLGDANIEKGTVRKIRITLGSRNRVVKNGTSYPLELQNETNNLLYVKLYNKHRHHAGRDSSNQKVWVDFDVARSIIERDGKFYLKPVLRPFNEYTYASVYGKVLPLEAKAVVRISDGKAFNGVALPDKYGRFKLRGLEAGTYTVTVQGLAPYKDKTISNISVTNGKAIDLGIITLTQ